MTTIERDTPTENRIELALMLRDLAYIREQIDTVCKNEDAQDARLAILERVSWALVSVTLLLMAILTPVASAAIKLWFHLP